MAEIEALRKEFDRRLAEKHQQILSEASVVSDYRELYCLIKKLSNSQEEFNVSMSELREKLFQPKQIVLF